MKAKEPIIRPYTSGNTIIPQLRSYLVDRVEMENDLEVLEQVYAVISASKSSFADKYYQAKEQTERFCTPELAKELEAEGYMIDKPYPYDDFYSDLDNLIEEDESDSNAPQVWVDKMFPELKD